MLNGSTFHELDSLLGTDADAMSRMIQRIEAPVRERTSEYLRQIVESIGANIPTSRQALMINDPYFIGAAHHRIRFDRAELIANFVHLLSVPAASVATWDGTRSALIVLSDDYDAGRETYGQAVPATEALVRALVDAHTKLKSSPAHAISFAGGTRRLAISRNCIGSSSISSLPGYSLIQQPEGATFGNRQLNGMVHEAIHGVLFLAECAAGRQLVKKGRATKVRSPWSGNELDVYQYVQALVVWYNLLTFWLRTDPRSEECIKAGRGFAGDNQALSLLEGIVDDIEPDFCEVLQACATKGGNEVKAA